MAIDPRPLGQRLMEDNWDLHRQAEHDTLPRHLVQGTIPRETYVELLGQFWLVARVLDGAIEAKRSQVPVLALVADEQLQTPYLEADLEHWGANTAAIAPKPGAAALIAEIGRCEREEPIRLFGLHYVREGANNGNRYVAKALRRAWGAKDMAGFSYLDPYGERQRPLWESFKARLDEQALSEDEKREIVAGARSMFEHIIAIQRDFKLPEPEAAGTR
ncbi:MAG: biliverdin-producing heme oxygenase [Phycisphaeraceae bacterium]|nr:MAG: biliverdin-producing heme oxygenase [Phycisphaeraceae bacterium]